MNGPITLLLNGGHSEMVWRILGQPPYVICEWRPAMVGTIAHNDMFIWRTFGFLPSAIDNTI